MTRILVIGDRNWDCEDIALCLLNIWKQDVGNLVIVQGGANGVDLAFRLACEELDVPCETYPADWDQYGKKAGPLRNQKMVDSDIDFCVAIHKNLKTSAGTKDCVKRALKKGIPVFVPDPDKMGNLIRIKTIQ